jgi:raffinose/stachyose/melibiose transport system permease protein
LAGVAGWFWLAVVLIPLYWIVITSFKAQSDYYQQNALAPHVPTRRWTTTAW